MISNNYQNQLNYGTVQDVVQQKKKERPPEGVKKFE